jgi:hypothetical protein
MKIQQYKILDPNAGLFSKGGIGADGRRYSWSKKGKLWASTGVIRRHLNLYIDYEYIKGSSKLELTNKIPEHWIVIEQDVSDDGQYSEKQYNAKLFYNKKHLE